MESRALVWIGLAIGSTVGGFIPALWGDGLFSFSSVLLSAAGGIAGIIIGFNLSN